MFMGEKLRRNVRCAQNVLLSLEAIGHLTGTLAQCTLLLLLLLQKPQIKRQAENAQNATNVGC